MNFSKTNDDEAMGQARSCYKNYAVLKSHHQVVAFSRKKINGFLDVYLGCQLHNFRKKFIYFRNVGVQKLSLAGYF